LTTLRILLTNYTLADRGGSDLYVRDVATALLERGRMPFVYSPLDGTVADELRLATIPVVDNLDGLGEVPNLIATFRSSLATPSASHARVDLLQRGRRARRTNPHRLRARGDRGRRARA